MTLVLLISLVIRAIALLLSIRLFLRMRDWRVVFLILMVSFMMLRQVLTMSLSELDWDITGAGAIAEIPGAVVSVLILAAVFFLAALLRDLRQAQKNIQDTASSFSLLFLANPLPMWVFDVETLRFLVVNDAAIEQYGYSREEFLGMTIKDIRPTVDVPRVMAHMAGQLEEYSPIELWRHRKKDGTVFRVEITGHGMSFQGRSARLILARDVTSEQNAFEALAESEEQLRLALEAGQMGMFNWDIQANKISWTPEHARMWGIKPGEFDGSYEMFASRIHPDDRVFVESRLEEAKAKRELYECECRVMRENGSYEWVNGRGRFEYGEDGAPVRMLGVVTDISERKNSERKSREHEEHLQRILDTALDGYILADIDGNILDVNPSYCALTGYSREELLSLNIMAIEAALSPEAVASRIRSITELGSVRFETRHRGKSGSIIELEVSISLMPGNTPLIAAFVRDITERKQSETRLAALHGEVQRSRGRLQRLSLQMIHAQETERGRVARELHDDIGQVLTSMKITFQTVKNLGVEGRAAALIDDTIEMVNQAMQRVRVISQDLRPALLDDLGLVPALRWYVDRHVVAAGIRGRVVGDETDERLPENVEITCFRVAQEALTNATRHSQAREIGVELLRNENVLRLRIADDGCGFDVDTMRSKPLQEKGFGLLSMQERVELLGGRFEISSELGKGTTVEAEFSVERT